MTQSPRKKRNYLVHRSRKENLRKHGEKKSIKKEKRSMRLRGKSVREHGEFCSSFRKKTGRERYERGGKEAEGDKKKNTPRKQAQSRRGITVSPR